MHFRGSMERQLDICGTNTWDLLSPGEMKLTALLKPLVPLIPGATAVTYNYFPSFACHSNTGAFWQRWISIITGWGRKLSSHRLSLACQKYGTAVGSKTDISYQHFISTAPTASWCRGSNILYMLIELKILRAQHSSFKVSFDFLNTGGCCRYCK